MNLDMTKGSPLKLILKFLVPVLLGCVFQQLYNMVDTIIVGKGVGSDALAAVGATGTIVFFILGFMNGLTTGFTVLSSQRYGAGDYEGLRKSVGNAFVLGLIVTVIMTIASLLGMDWLLRIMQTPEDIFDMSKEYIVIICVGIIFTTLYNLTASILRAVGNSKVPLYFLILSALLNVVLDLFFIMVLSWGVAGAAIATVMSRFVECGYLIIYTYRHSDKYRFIKGVYSNLHVPSSLVKKILLRGTPLLFNELLWAAGITMQTQALSTRGLSAIAGLNISNTLNNVVNTFFLTMGIAISIVIGQLIGAGKLKEAKETDTKMITFSLMISLGVSALLLIAAPLFPRIYNTTGEIRYLATRFILVYVLATPFNAFTNAAYFTLRSGGKTVMTFIFDSGFIWAVNVPVAMLLAHFTNLPIVWMFFIISMLDAIKSVVGFILVKKGDWLNIIVE